MSTAGCDRFDQVGLGDQNSGIQQSNTVRQDFAALMVVDHAGNRAALDRGQHRQHRIGRIAQHDADHVAPAHTALGEHGRITVRGLVSLPVADLLLTESDEGPVAISGSTVGENLPDRSFRTRLCQKPRQRGPDNHRRIHQNGGQLGGEAQQAHRTRCERLTSSHDQSSSPHDCLAHRSSAASTSPTTTSRSNAA